MSEYTKRQGIHIAEQWKGHRTGFSLDIEIEELDISGYGAKLGYITNKDNNRIAIRPNEYIVFDPDGDWSIMNAPAFEKEFELKTKVAKSDTSSKIDNKVQQRSKGITRGSAPKKTLML